MKGNYLQTINNVLGSYKRKKKIIKNGLKHQNNII